MMIVSLGSLKVAEVIANTKAATLKANVNTIKFVVRVLRLSSVETSTAMSNIAIKTHGAYVQKSPVLTGFSAAANNRRDVTVNNVKHPKDDLGVAPVFEADDRGHQG